MVERKRQSDYQGWILIFKICFQNLCRASSSHFKVLTTMLLFSLHSSVDYSLDVHFDKIKNDYYLTFDLVYAVVITFEI